MKYYAGIGSRNAPEHMPCNVVENKYPPVPVAYGQSCININTDFKCRNNCIYCFGKNWKDRHKIFQPEEIEKLIPNNINIPVGINNSASDPFQPKTIERTKKVLSLIQHKAEDVMLITKEYIDMTTIRFLENLKSRVFVFVSYSALPKEYENLVCDRRLETIENLSKSKLTSILYARPLIRRINDLNKIIELSEKVNCVVWSSVRVDNNNANELLPPPTGENLHKSHKRISNDDLEYIETFLKKCKVPVFRKTSCSISYLKNIPDYNAHWMSPELYGCNNCFKHQRKLCEKNKNTIPTFNQSIQDIIEKYKLPKYLYSVPGAFVLDSNMKQFSCLRAGILRKLTRFQVLFEYEKSLITAENLAYKHYELRGEEEGNIPI